MKCLPGVVLPVPARVLRMARALCLGVMPAYGRQSSPSVLVAASDVLVHRHECPRTSAGHRLASSSRVMSPTIPGQMVARTRATPQASRALGCVTVDLATVRSNTRTHAPPDQYPASGDALDGAR